MKLLFKQRFFSWFDSYDIYDEAGNTVYVVKGQLSWGHKLVIYDAGGREIGMVVQRSTTSIIMAGTSRVPSWSGITAFWIVGQIW